MIMMIRRIMFRRFITWLFLYDMIALLWVGAEYVFEGAVHSSHIDSVVNGILATYMLRDWYKLNK